jgi:hypothetical protein
MHTPAFSYLVWHSATANLTLGDALAKVLEADVGPEVLAEVQQDDVHATHQIKEGSLIIVVAHLSGVLLTGQPQLFIHKGVGERAPVFVRVRREVSVQSAGCSAELG